jgi:hypothetical protein
VVKPSEYFALEGEAITLLFAGVDELFEGKKVASHSFIFDKIDRTIASLPQKAFYDIAIPYDGSNRKCQVDVLHHTPQLMLNCLFIIGTG